MLLSIFVLAGVFAHASAEAQSTDLGASGPIPVKSASAEESGPRFLVTHDAAAKGADDYAAVFAELGLRVISSLPELGMHVVSPQNSDPPDSLEPLQAKLLAVPGVERVEPDQTRELGRVPDDPEYFRQWALEAAGFPESWDYTVGIPEVVIAVLDSGVVRNVPDLSERIVSPYSVFYSSSEWPAWEDVVGHGTAVASVAAAGGDDGRGVCGAAWDVGLMPVHLSDDGSFLLSQEIEGILWAVENGADIINISAGSAAASAAEREAVSYARSQGVLVVAAAGNGTWSDEVEYPAAYPEVLAVGASGFGDEPVDFSATGDDLDLVAPGVAIWSYWADLQSYWLQFNSGTSFAAPLVSGAAALMLSAVPDLSPDDLTRILTESAHDLGPPGRDDQFGWGRLDAGEAVRRAVGESSTAASSTTTTTDASVAPPTSTTSTVVTTTTTTTTTPTNVTIPDTSTTTVRAPSTTTTQLKQVFADVPPDHPYAEAIVGLARAAVVQGYGDGSFGPERRVMRQQFAKMVVKSLDISVSESDECPFPDVGVSGSSGLYPDNFVGAAYKWGITRGYEGDPALFRPYDAVSRAQMVSMIVRAIDRKYPAELEDPPPGFSPPFGRFSPAHDEAAARAAWNGLLDQLEGMGPGYDMWQSATRGEVASILHLLVG